MYISTDNITTRNLLKNDKLVFYIEYAKVWAVERLWQLTVKQMEDKMYPKVSKLKVTYSIKILNKSLYTL